MYATTPTTVRWKHHLESVLKPNPLCRDGASKSGAGWHRGGSMSKVATSVQLWTGANPPHTIRWPLLRFQLGRSAGLDR